MKCTLSDITIGTYNTINLNEYGEAMFKYRQSIECLVESKQIDAILSTFRYSK